MSPRRKLSTTEAAFPYGEQLREVTATDILLLKRWDNHAARNGG